MKVFCCKCGRDQYEDYIDSDNGYTYETAENEFTIIDSNIYCKTCWNKEDFFCKK